MNPFKVRSDTWSNVYILNEAGRVVAQAINHETAETIVQLLNEACLAGVIDSSVSSEPPHNPAIAIKAQ